MAHENIDYFVVEVDYQGYDLLEIVDQFRAAILAHLEKTDEFTLRV